MGWMIMRFRGVMSCNSLIALKAKKLRSR
jgi:hypothetical protein